MNFALISSALEIARDFHLGKLLQLNIKQNSNETVEECLDAFLEDLKDLSIVIEQTDLSSSQIDEVNKLVRMATLQYVCGIITPSK